MPRAYDPRAINFAFAKRTALMNARVFGRIELAIGVKQGKRPAPNFNYFTGTFRNIADARNLGEFGQLRGSSRSVLGIDFDVIVTQVTGGYGCPRFSHFQVQGKAKFALLHTRTSLWERLEIKCATIGDFDTGEIDIEPFRIEINASLSGRHRDTAEIRVTPKKSRFDQGRIRN